VKKESTKTASPCGKTALHYSLALQGFFLGQTASNLLHYERSAHNICIDFMVVGKI